MLKVPILFIVFNRPEKTGMVLAQIAKYKPEQLYVVADGARPHIETDLRNCEKVREIITSGIDWYCEKKIIFRDTNFGSRKSVSDAITWFFTEEPYGIILEDDCLPHVSFFDYAAELLLRFENDESIFSIAGSNFGYHFNSLDSYFASRYFNMWGWASWRRVAQKIDYNLTGWKSKSNFSKLVFLIKMLSYKHKDLDLGWILYWKNIFNKVSNNILDTCWDYQWFYFQFQSSGITIFPSSNLIENIGFDSQATHTLSIESINGFPNKELPLPLVHPVQLQPDIEFEEKYIKKKWAYYKRLSLFWHIKHTIHQSFIKAK